MRIQLTVDAENVTWEVEPGETLLSALRRQGHFSVKRGCETGDCGACTVLFDGQPVNTCVVAAPRAKGHALTTIVGLREDPLLQRLQEAFVKSGAIQCGYCTPGMLLSLFALVKEGGLLDESAVRHALSGNLCRCTGYVKPVQSVLDAWEGGS